MDQVLSAEAIACMLPDHPSITLDAHLRLNPNEEHEQNKTDKRKMDTPPHGNRTRGLWGVAQVWRPALL